MMNSIIDVFRSMWRFFLYQFRSINPDENAIVEVFYGNFFGGLSIIGTMAVIMAGVGLFLLVFNLVRSFLNK